MAWTACESLCMSNSRFTVEAVEAIRQPEAIGRPLLAVQGIGRRPFPPDIMVADGVGRPHWQLARKLVPQRPLPGHRVAIGVEGIVNNVPGVQQQFWPQSLLTVV